MYFINVLASVMASDSNTYSNLLGTVVSLISEFVIANKNLVKSLKKHTHLERVLSQFQQTHHWEVRQRSNCGGKHRLTEKISPLLLVMRV